MSFCEDETFKVKTLVEMKPTTSKVYIDDHTPDRPQIPFYYTTRKSRSAADILSTCSQKDDYYLYQEVRFRRDEASKSIVMKSNYDYNPKNGDELKLKRGSTIRVLRRDCDDGWWYGETEDGRKGFFPQNHVQLAPGKVNEINNDELQYTGLLGSGGFCVVKSAIYKNKNVAVKIPHSKFSEKEIRQAVQEEASIFQMLSHENIVEMYGVLVGAKFGLVFELCCDSLSSVCSSSKDILLSEEIISYWGLQIAQGMKYLHDLNVIHRDLKAANVLIKEKVCECLLSMRPNITEQVAHSMKSDDGVCYKCGGSALNRLTLKIADLGLSKRIQVTDCRMSVVGTVPYLAPEVIRDRKCSKAMDVWSFGLVLWEVLTGAVPFEGLGQGAVQLQIGTFVKQKIPSSCPPDLKYIIDWCWMDDPQQRPTFKELTVQFKKFGEKFKTIDLHDQKFLENSMNTLRKSMMEEIAAIADEMMKKANELQKREENLKKGERELKLNQMIFELQQTLSREAPKEKPQPPKRRPHLKCSDISEPFDCKTEISLTKDLQMIKSPNGERSSSTSNGISNSDEQYSECVMSGFATLPRTPKKLSFPTETHEFCFPPKVDSKIPSKSQPDLVKLYRQRININNISPTNSNCNTLHRVNACRHKKERTRDLDRADYVDEECIVVVSDADLEESLQEKDDCRQSSIDHLATPRRVQMNLSSRNNNHARSVITTEKNSGSKGSDDDKRFFRNFFKLMDKSPNRSGTWSLPRPTIMAVPLGSTTVGSSIISKSLVTSKYQGTFAKNTKSNGKKTTVKPKKKSKQSAQEKDKEKDKFVLTKNSRIFVKPNSGERRMSLVSSVANTFRNSNYLACDDSSNNNLRVDEPYEKLSDASDGSLLENPSYIPPSSYLRGRASTSDISMWSSRPITSSRSQSSSQTSFDDPVPCSSFGIIENLSYRPPSDMKLRIPTSTPITLDSPVEGGIDDTQITINRSGSPFERSNFEDRSTLSHSLSHFVEEDDAGNSCYNNQRTTRDVTLHATPLADDAIDIDVSLNPYFSLRIDDSAELLKLPCGVPATQAPPPPSLVHSPNITRPQRPYTLDLNTPVTPTESGISTAGSSYRSLPSADPAPPHEHAPPPPVDYPVRIAPPIPPRINARRSEDDSLSRLKLSPVFQSP